MTIEKKIFTFRVTRDCTESAVAIVEAATIAEAHEIALTRDYAETLDFSPDDGSGDETYIADDDDWQEISAEEAAQLRASESTE
jgi:hypothetical protein